jgi:hypothetical protein
MTLIPLEMAWIYHRSLLVPLYENDFHLVVLCLTKHAQKWDIAKDDPGSLLSILALSFSFPYRYDKSITWFTFSHTIPGYLSLDVALVFREKCFSNSFMMKNGTQY